MDASLLGGFLTVTCATELSTCWMIAELGLGLGLASSNILGDLTHKTFNYFPE